MTTKEELLTEIKGIVICSIDPDDYRRKALLEKIKLLRKEVIE